MSLENAIFITPIVSVILPGYNRNAGRAETIDQHFAQNRS